METTSTHRDLLALERRYWQAIQDRDMTALIELTDFPVIVTGAQGVGTLERATFESMLNDPHYTIESFAIDEDAHVRLVSDDVAILAYKVHEDLTVDGRLVSLDAADASTWVRHEDGWVCALHTEAILGDPFGRDRAD